MVNTGKPKNIMKNSGLLVVDNGSYRDNTGILMHFDAWVDGTFMGHSTPVDFWKLMGYGLSNGFLMDSYGYDESI